MSPHPIPIARPVALVTGVGRTAGIGAGIARQLAVSGWDIAFSYWTPYDARMTWCAEAEAADTIGSLLADGGAAVAGIEADLSDPADVFDEAERQLGPITALVMCHCESVASGILDTTLESFDRPFAVNARATWLLIREFGRRYRGKQGAGRIIALTSDHVDGNVPYGVGQAALDRITLAAARALAPLGICANIINPGPALCSPEGQWINGQLLSSNGGFA